MTERAESTNTAGIAGLDPIWRVVFDQAWLSWQQKNFGIGAALVDPADGSIVSVGRNRVLQEEPELRTLSGNMTAHAEMNAFASLDRWNAEGLHLYTTLEPCLMCIGTAMQLKVAHVHAAQRDEFFHGMDAIWAQHEVTASRYPTQSDPLPGRLGQLARLLPLTYNLRHFPNMSAAAKAKHHRPQLTELAQRIVDAEFNNDELGNLRDLPNVDAALVSLWDLLPEEDEVGPA